MSTTENQPLPPFHEIHSRVVDIFTSLAPASEISPEEAYRLYDIAHDLEEVILKAHGFKVRKRQAPNPAKMPEINSVVVDLLHREGPEAYNLRTDAEIIQVIEKRTGKTTTRQTLAKCKYHHHARQLRGARRDRKLYTDPPESFL